MEGRQASQATSEETMTSVSLRHARTGSAGRTIGTGGERRSERSGNEDTNNSDSIDENKVSVASQ
ncbi:hypothetical protein E2C01_092469 [Portunus trituberculatus]|uniref:Uncharacterized protein n=1 Tax=Portunus trituberculatus TaxID=210409 RepID=A0A5B7JGJ0_PORTR|nr:hypothetical protein [Portunus trituberculatus]